MIHTLWVELYRPHTIEDCILPQTIKKTFQEIITSGVVPNLMLHGKTGCGKTTVAKALCDELDLSWYFINASKDGNIDTLRTQITDFCHAQSFSGERKVVIFDEADYLNPNSTQPALRAFIEEFAINTSFIFTCNAVNRIIAPLHGRTAVIDFSIPAAEVDSLRKQFLKRVRFILDTEKITYDPMTLAQLIVKFWPDMRRVINELQRYSLSGNIDEGILKQIKDVPMSELLVALRRRDFKTVRTWCAVNHENDSVRVMRKMFDALYEVFDPESIPAVVLLIGQYQFQAAFVADQEIHLTAFLTELMQTADWKKEK